MNGEEGTTEVVKPEQPEELSEAEVRRLWAEGDASDKRRAFEDATIAHTDIVEEVLRDAEHPLYTAALQRLAFAFRSSPLFSRLVDALDDPREAIRAEAADLLAWPEPVAARPRLLRVAREGRGDAAYEARGAELLERCHDPRRELRRTAVYQLSQLAEPYPPAAPFLWDYLHRSNVYGCPATECLDAWVLHAPPGERAETLVALALHRQRLEDVRQRAVAHLIDLEASESIVEPLWPLLAEEPAHTWALHIELLELVARHGRPVALGHLAEVDDLWLQVAVLHAELALGGVARRSKQQVVSAS